MNFSNYHKILSTVIAQQTQKFHKKTPISILLQ